MELLGNNVEYCEFPANIILSASEQEERVKVRDKRVQTVQVKRQTGGINTPVVFIARDRYIPIFLSPALYYAVASFGITAA